MRNVFERVSVSKLKGEERKKSREQTLIRMELVGLLSFFALFCQELADIPTFFLKCALGLEVANGREPVRASLINLYKIIVTNLQRLEAAVFQKLVPSPYQQGEHH
jgi:hypothetical protein